MNLAGVRDIFPQLGVSSMWLIWIVPLGFGVGSARIRYRPLSFSWFVCLAMVPVFGLPSAHAVEKPLNMGRGENFT